MIGDIISSRTDCIALLMPIDNEARAIIIETREVLDHWIGW